MTLPLITPAFGYAQVGNTTLENTILQKARGTVRHSLYGGPEITADLRSVTEAVESTFVLVPRIRQAGAKIKSITPAAFGGPGKTFLNENGVNLFVKDEGRVAIEEARKVVDAAIAVVAHFEKLEKDRAAAKAAADKAAADAAAKARGERLDSIADEYFGKPYLDLGPHKTAAVVRILELEDELEQALEDDE